MDKKSLLNHATIAVLYEKHNFPSADKLYKIIKENNFNIPKSEIKEYLNNQEENQLLTVPSQRKSDLGHITASYKNEFWQMDLFDLSKYYKSNKPYKYILAVVDVFTRYAYCQPVESKTNDDVLHAFKIIISKRAKAIPNVITSDSDSTFLSNEFQEFLKKLDIIINPVILKDHHALGIIDRFARTLKTILSKYYIRTKSTNWIDKLQTVIENYNHSQHDGILHLTPTEASLEINNMKLFKHNATKSIKNNIVSDLVKGDKVRLKLDATFKKGTEPNYSDEVYVVRSTHGKMITLDNGEVKKRSSLLKVPNDTISSSKNVIHQTNTTQRINRRLNKAGVDEANIRTSTRERKKKTIVDV
jgi:hypothetical protein